MKNKKERACPKIISINDNICLRKLRYQPEYGCTKKIHANSKQHADHKVDHQKIIQKTVCLFISFFFTQTYRFRNQYSRIYIINKAGKEDHGSKNKEIDIDDLDTEMVLKLKYNEEEYELVKEQLSKIAATPEQAVWKLLGNE